MIVAPEAALRKDRRDSRIEEALVFWGLREDSKSAQAEAQRGAVHFALPPMPN